MFKNHLCKCKKTVAGGLMYTTVRTAMCEVIVFGELEARDIREDSHG